MRFIVISVLLKPVAVFETYENIGDVLEWYCTTHKTLRSQTTAAIVPKLEKPNQPRP